MRKKALHYLVLSLSLFLFSCNSDNDEEVDEGSITVTAKYSTKENPDEKKIDVGAKVFLYYGIYTMDIAGWDYNNGLITKGDSIIYPDQSVIIPENGIIKISPHRLNDKLTIVVESNYYTGRYLSDSYSPSFKEIILHATFQ